MTIASFADTTGQIRVQYTRGRIWGRETSRGYGRNPRVTYYYEWERSVYSHTHGAWVQDGCRFVPERATRRDVRACFGA